MASASGDAASSTAPAAHVPPHAALGARTGWQDTIFEAIMDAEPKQIWDALERSPQTALDSQLQRREVGGNVIFIWHERLYAPNVEGMREVLGSGFEFEGEAPRARVGRWLEMIDARNGDTLLHLVMRLNGIEDLAKASCAVEILGRGASFEITNVDGELCSMVDPCFKLAWLKELPAWKQRREAAARERQRAEAAERRAAAERGRRDQVAAERQAQKAREKDARKRELAEVEEAKYRRTFHSALDKMLVKLDKREERQAKANPAWNELMTDVRAMIRPIERWFEQRR